MKTASEILNSETLVQDLADVIGYNYLRGNESILVHKNSGEFRLVSSDKVGYMVSNQGWTECVASDTLTNLLGTGDMSDDGMVEAAKVASWMKNADNDPMGQGSY